MKFCNSVLLVSVFLVGFSQQQVTSPGNSTTSGNDNYVLKKREVIYQPLHTNFIYSFLTKS